MRRAYNRRQIQKYSQLATTQEQICQALGQSATVNDKNKPEVPFGIRAIESGIEVDGIWISGSNSNVTSTLASPTPSIKGGPPKPSSEGYSLQNTQVPTLNRPRSDKPSTRRHPVFMLPPLPPPSFRRTSYQPRRSSALRYSDSYELDERDEEPASPPLRPLMSGSDSRVDFMGKSG